MNTLISMIGDGEGNTSSTRVMLLLVLLFWMAMKFYNAAITHQPIVLDGTDLAFLSGLFGTKLLHGQQETSSLKTPQTTTKP